MSVSNVIKAAMSLQHISRAELAANMGTTPASLSVKLNRSAWSVGDLIRAAAAMRLTVALLDDEGRQIITFRKEDADPPRRSNTNDK